MKSHPKIHPRLHQVEPLRRCRLEECKGACCLHGAWVDLHLQQEILNHSNLIAPLLPGLWQEPESWFQPDIEADPHALSGQTIHTSVIDQAEHYGGTACIFWLPDAKCALQVAGQTAGMHHWRLKPFYCILHPLIIDEQGRITLDETGAITSEPASCLRISKTAVPLTEIFQEELDYFLNWKA